MLKRVVLMAALTAGLVACSPAEDTETASVEVPDAPAPVAEATPADPSDPYLQLYPWDPDREGVVKTESGLQYYEIKAGPEGGAVPDPRDRVTVHYDGRLARNGEKFDSSFDRGLPATFGVTQVIAGWVEALQLMSEGDEWMLFIPSELGYGQNPRPGGVIQPGDDLMFRVSLNTVIPGPKPQEPATETWAAYTPWDSDKDGVIQLDNGLEYVVIESGPEDGVMPELNQQLAVHYEGRFASTGETFDSSLARGQRAIFHRGGVIPGWTEILGEMRPGDHWLVYIPSDLAYGPQGRGPIGPNEDLIFEIQLFDIL